MTGWRAFVFYAAREFEMNPSAELIKKTIDVWQPLSKKELNEEDVREIIENITGFFSTLKRWDDQERRKQESERNRDL